MRPPDDTLELVLGGTLTMVARKKVKIRALVTVTYQRFQITAWGDDMAYTLPANHQVEVQVKYVDDDGNPATVDGDVVWATSDEHIATVEVDAENSTKATISQAHSVGAVQITATADADLGQGTRELVTLMDVTVIPGEAVAGNIEPTGAPTPIS